MKIFSLNFDYGISKFSKTIVLSNFHLNSEKIIFISTGSVRIP